MFELLELGSVISGCSLVSLSLIPTPLSFSALDCLNCDVRLGTLLLSYPTRFLPLVDTSLQLFQHSMLTCPSNALQAHGDGQHQPKVWTMKKNIHARFHSLPLIEDRYWKKNLGTIQSSDVSHLVTLTGTVIRTGTIRMIESSREYECTKCEYRFLQWSDLDQGHTLVAPDSCPSSKGGGRKKKCKSTSFTIVPGSSDARDFQRIKIQDAMMKLGLGSMPKSIYVTLHDDLVDRCHAGDEIEVVGIIRRYWNTPLYKDAPCHCELYIDAVHIRVKHDRRVQSEVGTTLSTLTEEFVFDFKRYWREALNASKELLARNLLVSSFCPKLYGLFSVKLAVMLTIIGGVRHQAPSGTRVRGECHLLLVGDAGTGKSQLLKYATKVSPRSILTTGMGTTSAGLTVATVKEPGGEWGLEAGALVLADGGVCCIDEFGCIRDHDRATIHEAMEQQTVSVAKAGLVCTLNTRTTVFGAMNPKGSYDHDADLSVNTALATPLLSRFDLVLLMLDKHNSTWDEQVVSYIMDGLERPIEEEVINISRESYEAEANLRRTRTNHNHNDAEGAMGTQAPSQDAGDTQNRRQQEMRPWELERLQAYIQYVRYHFFPILTPLAQRLLTRYYQYQRAADSRSAARTTIRLLESLVRLTQAHARLMWRHRATAQDALMAILVMESSLASCSVGGSHPHLSLGPGLGLMDDPASADLVADAQLEALLQRLELRPTKEEINEEDEANERNESDILGDGEDLHRKRLQRQEHARLESLARDEARRAHEAELERASRRPLSFENIGDSIAAAAGAVARAPSAFATTPMTSMHLIQIPTTNIPTRTHNTNKPTASNTTTHPNRNPRMSISAHSSATSRPVDVRLNMDPASSQVPFDPFGTLLHSTPIPALSNSQMQNVGTPPSSAPSPSASSSEPPHTLSGKRPAIAISPADHDSISSPAPSSTVANSNSTLSRPLKRPRLGIAAPRAHTNTNVDPTHGDNADDDDDDEDQSIMMLTQVVSASKRSMSKIRVKQENEVDGTNVPTPDKRNPIPFATTSSISAVSPSVSHPPPPAAAVDPLQELMKGGMSRDLAQSILANPLRVAAVTTTPATPSNSNERTKGKEGVTTASMATNNTNTIAPRMTPINTTPATITSSTAERLNNHMPHSTSPAHPTPLHPHPPPPTTTPHTTTHPIVTPLHNSNPVASNYAWSGKSHIPKSDPVRTHVAAATTPQPNLPVPTSNPMHVLPPTNESNQIATPVSAPSPRPTTAQAILPPPNHTLPTTLPTSLPSTAHSQTGPNNNRPAPSFGSNSIASSSPTVPPPTSLPVSLPLSRPVTRPLSVLHAQPTRVARPKMGLPMPHLIKPNTEQQQARTNTHTNTTMTMPPAIPSLQPIANTRASSPPITLVAPPPTADLPTNSNPMPPSSEHTGEAVSSSISIPRPISSAISLPVARAGTMLVRPTMTTTTPMMMHRPPTIRLVPAATETNNNQNVNNNQSTTNDQPTSAAGIALLKLLGARS